MLIAVEGLTNSGKTTLCRRLLPALGETCPSPVTLINKDLEQDAASAALKTITSPVNAQMELDPLTEMLLYCAHLSRKASIIHRNGWPSAEIDIVDRFSLSVLCFFTSVRGLSREVVHRTVTAAAQGIDPDLTVLLDVPLHSILERSEESPLTRKDVGIEGYWEDLRNSYLAELRSSHRNFITIDGSRDIASAVAKVSSVVESMS